jgi:hypothetical protein
MSRSQPLIHRFDGFFAYVTDTNDTYELTKLNIIVFYAAPLPHSSISTYSTCNYPCLNTTSRMNEMICTIRLHEKTGQSTRHRAYICLPYGDCFGTNRQRLELSTLGTITPLNGTLVSWVPKDTLQSILVVVPTDSGQPQP